MDRRTLLKSLGLAGGALLVPRLPAAPVGAGPLARGEPFSYAGLKGMARHFAGQPYHSHEKTLPKAIQALTWDHYQAIRYRPDHALWADLPGADFRVQFFHLGLNFKTPVKMHEVVDGESHPVPYRTDLFDFSGTDVDAASLPEGLGFAGFRLLHHSDWKRDVAAFLGASYFRATGASRQFGLSARGLAVNTALPEPEEFPEFTHFWFERTDHPDQVRVYAFLDSPSVTGAYRFTIERVDGDVIMDVDTALYPRQPIERLGVAPLTSMYQIGENSRRVAWDWRPEIHDSDGLALHTGGGEWLWRPLVNPPQLRFNSYSDENPRGFGLLQRDQDFDHYQDDGVFYERRPSLWVEPRGDWGKGAVQLVEIPTLDETFDNIVAFWRPDRPVRPGEEYLFAYRLSWTGRPPRPPLAHCVATRTGLGGVIGRPRDYFSWRFVVDFRGGPLSDGSLPDNVEVVPVIDTGAGRVEITSARPLHAIDGYRAMFDLVPPEDDLAPINLRLFLKRKDSGQPLTETWIYQWTPPPLDQRDLRNPGHL
ncbi:glucan biosynthesis protein [Alloalcanivorax gelatiniphagus]|uniref:Glucan biosynthesis protein D n=1 Tax=Alloalcanivorax gelatiniphagus TaxID=1194167 RepID=A0ABY2XIK3_9GAMM|nr:glucan biosynthesis protein D [Alloalcanivorax gelatiniphagus]TMW11288.1 glucan biosynthesis protein D [Alloalcanivorax gelatiniphagus]